MLLYRLLLEDCTVIGSLKTINLDIEVQRKVSEAFQTAAETASAFFRATINGETYYSRAYDRARVRNSYTVEYIDNERHKFGYIEYFISLKAHTAAVITPLTPTQNFCYPASLRVLRRNLVPVCVASSICVISLSCILHKCVCVSLSNYTYIARYILIE